VTVADGRRSRSRPSSVAVPHITAK
jgi:hypothetical protein